MLGRISQTKMSEFRYTVFSGRSQKRLRARSYHFYGLKNKQQTYHTLWGMLPKQLDVFSSLLTELTWADFCLCSGKKF